MNLKKNNTHKNELILFLNINDPANNQVGKLTNLNLNGCIFYSKENFKSASKYHLIIKLPKLFIQKGIIHLNIFGTVENCNYNRHLNNYQIDFQFTNLNIKQKDTIKKLLINFSIPDNNFKLF